MNVDGWPEQEITFDENSITVRLRVSSDDMKDPTVSCAETYDIEDFPIVLNGGQKSCLSGNSQIVLFSIHSTDPFFVWFIQAIRIKILYSLTIVASQIVIRYH